MSSKTQIRNHLNYKNCNKIDDDSQMRDMKEVNGEVLLIVIVITEEIYRTFIKILIYFKYRIVILCSTLNKILKQI